MIKRRASACSNWLIRHPVFVSVHGTRSGMSWRCNLDFFEWNQDGALDFVIGSGRVVSTPNCETGYPMDALDENPVVGGVVQTGGAHETGAVGTMLGKDGPNLLICNEAGRMFLLPGTKLKAAP